MGRTNQTDELDDPLIVMIDGKRTKLGKTGKKKERVQRGENSQNPVRITHTDEIMIRRIQSQYGGLSPLNPNEPIIFTTGDH